MASKATKVRHFNIVVGKVRWRPWKVLLTVDDHPPMVAQRGDTVIITHTVNFTDGEE